MAFARVSKFSGGLDYGGLILGVNHGGHFD